MFFLYLSLSRKRNVKVGSIEAGYIKLYKRTIFPFPEDRNKNEQYSFSIYKKAQPQLPEKKAIQPINKKLRNNYQKLFAKIVKVKRRRKVLVFSAY